MSRENRLGCVTLPSNGECGEGADKACYIPQKSANQCAGKENDAKSWGTTCEASTGAVAGDDTTSGSVALALERVARPVKTVKIASGRRQGIGGRNLRYRPGLLMLTRGGRCKFTV